MPALQRAVPGELADMVELHRLRIVNAAGGQITASRDQSRSWQAVGQVLRGTEQVNPRGFTASKWVRPGRVCATAVNAIHITAGYDAAQGSGIVFSLLPREFADERGEWRSFLSPDSSIYTDIGAGETIFGGGLAPFVGNQVYLEREGALVTLPAGYIPARGDVLVIPVLRPREYPSQIVLENRFGGLIWLHYPSGERFPLGCVLKPVLGVGRFEGTRYAAAGRLRANHAGVIDISTSPLGEIGGFQIIPREHAMSPEMGAARRYTQWMVVGPLDARQPSWEGLPPLFYQYLRPAYRPDDLGAEDWEARLLARFLVEAEIEGKWQAMPRVSLGTEASAPLPEEAFTALEQVTAFRILFPVERRADGDCQRGRDP